MNARRASYALCLNAGAITYRTLEGLSDQTETIPAGGAAIEVAGTPVVLQAVRSGTADRIIVIGIV